MSLSRRMRAGHGASSGVPSLHAHAAPAHILAGESVRNHGSTGQHDVLAADSRCVCTHQPHRICLAIVFSCRRTAIGGRKQRGKSYAVLLGSIAAGLLYSCSPLPWLYATGSEVFALNNLFAALLVYLTVKYARNPRCDAVIYAGAFVSGLGLCNQHTLILFEAPAIAWILWTQRKVMARGKFLKLSLCFFTGLLPYAYLPIIQFTAPKRGSWGELTSLQGFWRHFRRADYGTFRLYSVSQETEGLFERLAAHLWDFTERQSLYIGPFVALYGIWLSLSRKKRRPDLPERERKKMLQRLTTVRPSIHRQLRGRWCQCMHSIRWFFTRCPTCPSRPRCCSVSTQDFGCSQTLFSFSFWPSIDGCFISERRHPMHGGGRPHCAPDGAVVGEHGSEPEYLLAGVCWRNP